MPKYHKNLSETKWFTLPLAHQMANVGSDVSRTIRWKGKDKDNSKLAFYRALELLQLTMKDPKNKRGLRELSRVREMLVDWFLGNPEYKSTDEEWDRYFLQFNIAARMDR